MRVLMLGWEFPPFISGGLGTACYGLTKALDAHGHEIVFVLPKTVPADAAGHLRLVSPDAPDAPQPQAASGGFWTRREGQHVPGAPGAPGEPFERTRFLSVPAAVPSAYASASSVGYFAETERGTLPGAPGTPGHDIPGSSAFIPFSSAMRGGWSGPAGGADYDGDMMAAADRYARMAIAKCAHLDFDVIHAHDWLTYPAGAALKAITGRPLVIHVHSTEFDRSGEHVNQRIYDIERMGMHIADAVICVSYLTRSICERRYSAPVERLHVVYNGVEFDDHGSSANSHIEAGDKIVLFLGRITMQKGPEYFVAAAKRVLEKYDKVKFIVAGSGDMARGMIEQAAALGIGHKVLFTGFLRGNDVHRIFRMADCYVMPSVSEPFGIAPLEAMSHDVPVIISRQSGVSEVLTHALKVDFWDIDEMADKILAVLRHPPLSRTLREHGAMEVRRLTWEGAATRCEQVYGRVMASRHEMSAH